MGKGTGHTELPDTKMTSKRIWSNTAEQVESVVVACIPNWRSYPRVLRAVLASLYRYGNLDECLDDMQNIEMFADHMQKYATAEQKAEVRKFAEAWFVDGKLPKRGKTSLTFTLLNQQLFYESTIASNTKMYLSQGNQSASDVKMAIEGGYGNALEMERTRHNAIRKAQADKKARDILSEVALEGDTEAEQMFEGREIEYIPPVEASTEWGEENEA